VASCPDADVLCTGNVTVTGGGARKSKKGGALASGPIELSSAFSQSITVTLSKRGKKLLLKKGKLKVTAAVSVTGPNGKPATATNSGKIRQPGSKRSHH